MQGRATARTRRASSSRTATSTASPSAITPDTPANVRPRAPPPARAPTSDALASAHARLAWRTIGASRSFVRRLKTGVFLSLSTWPRARAFAPERVKSTEDAAFIDGKIQEMLQERTVEVTTAGAAHVVSPIFVTRRGKKPRLIVDFKASGVNAATTPIYHSMETVATVRELITPGARMFAADIKAAYHHVRVAARHRPLLCFAWRGTMYRFRALPFGLAPSGALLAMTLRPMMRFMRAAAANARGKVRFNLYVDDLLGIVDPNAPPPPPLPLTGEAAPVAMDVARQWSWWTQRLLGLLCLRTNEKCTWEPATSIEYLGMNWDSTPREGGGPRVRLPHAKLHELRRETRRICTALEQGREISGAELRRFVGRATAAMPAVTPTRLYLHELNAEARRAIQADRPVHLSPAAWVELRFWRDTVVSFASAPASTATPAPDLELRTDASGYGWGAELRRPGASTLTARGDWTAADKEQAHINQKELRAVELALRAFKVSDAAVQLFTDNTTTLYYVNKLMGRRRELTLINRSLFNYCHSRRVHLTAAHVPGTENTIPDMLSRIRDPSNFAVAPWALRTIQERFGTLTWDRFASAANHLPGLPYNSLYMDPTSAGVDALSQPAACWRRHLNWLNPPWRLILKTLVKVRETRARAVLLAPVWRTAPWWPMLVAMLRAPPLVLTRRRPLLFDLNRDRWAPRRRWAMAAFLL